MYVRGGEVHAPRWAGLRKVKFEEVDSLDIYLYLRFNNRMVSWVLIPFSHNLDFTLLTMLYMGSAQAKKIKVN